MLILLHLSDLHFALRDGGTQFDRDEKIRAAIIRDLEIEGRTGFDAMLVTGDLAFSGQPKEFERAEQWFEQVRSQIKIPATSVYVIPGNHDVNRDHVGKNSVLMEAHKAVRSITDAHARDANVAAKLKDAGWDFLRPLGEYRNYAVKHDCPTSATALSWDLRLPKLLDDGTPVRLHGFNSALLSNEFDDKANLVLTEFQFHRLASSEGCVEVVMCHHPPSWLLDGNEAEDRYMRYANLVLTGHEHQSRCFNQGPGLRVCAGAVHPSRGENNWQPSYNIIRISVETSLGKRTLVSDVETRNWHKTNLDFVAAPYTGHNASPNGHYVHRQELPLTRIAQSPPIPDTNGAVTPELVIVPQDPPTTDEVAFAAGRRRLIVHFFRLGVVKRYEVVIAVGLYDEADEALEGQARWYRVFERAEQNKKISELWSAVAGQDNSLAGEANPFTPGT